jgi:Fur family peroxide stress response transcriptional regulator
VSIRLVDIQGKLAEAGLKATQQRLVIYKALHDSRQHLSAEQLYRIILPDHPTISLGTVYKTLDTFVEKGLIRRVPCEDGTLRFDARMDMHHHIFCEDTGEIMDWDDAELNALLAEYLKKKQLPGLEVVGVQLQITARRQASKPDTEA